MSICFVVLMCCVYQKKQNIPTTIAFCKSYRKCLGKRSVCIEFILLRPVSEWKGKYFAKQTQLSTIYTLQNEHCETNTNTYPHFAQSKHICIYRSVQTNTNTINESGKSVNLATKELIFFFFGQIKLKRWRKITAQICRCIVVAFHRGDDKHYSVSVETSMRLVVERLVVRKQF